MARSTRDLASLAGGRHVAAHARWAFMGSGASGGQAPKRQLQRTWARGWSKGGPSPGLASETGELWWGRGTVRAQVPERGPDWV